MDFSGLLIIPLSAIVTFAWIIVAALLSRPASGFGKPFLLSYALAILLMQPWHIWGWRDAGMVAAMLGTLFFWVAGGCLVGGGFAMILVKLSSKLMHRSR